MLFIGLQFAIWAVTGLYMVYLDIHYIHGDSLVNNKQNKIETSRVSVSFNELLSQFPEAENIRLGQLVDSPIYRFSHKGQQHMLDAETGSLLAPITKQQASILAKREFSGSADIIALALITQNPPFELSARRLPAWRVDFAGFGSPTLYISATSGEVVTKRHSFWRIFDWMFRLHVMDYDDGADIDNILLSIIGILGLISTLFGVRLTYHHTLESVSK